MNEFRLEYQRETGIQIGDTIDQDDIANIYYPDTDDIPELDIAGWIDVKEYVEWLEQKLLEKITFTISGKDLVTILKRHEGKK